MILLLCYPYTAFATRECGRRHIPYLDRSSVRLQTVSLAYGGDAIAREPGGRTVFVHGAAPGDIIDAEITEEH